MGNKEDNEKQQGEIKQMENEKKKYCQIGSGLNVKITTAKKDNNIDKMEGITKMLDMHKRVCKICGDDSVQQQSNAI